jgi:hypothetical protein
MTNTRQRLVRGSSGQSWLGSLRGTAAELGVFGVPKKAVGHVPTLGTRSKLTAGTVHALDQSMHAGVKEPQKEKVW